MGETPVVEAQRLLVDAVDALTDAASSAGDADLVSVLTTCENVARRLDRLTVTTIATLHQRGTFTEHGYRTPAAALEDLLGWERYEARRRVLAADQIAGRARLDGTPPTTTPTRRRLSSGRRRRRVRPVSDRRVTACAPMTLATR